MKLINVKMTKLLKTAIIADCMLIVLTLAFIFGNSLLTVEKSNNASSGIVDMVEQIPPVQNAITNDKITKPQLTEIVRSFAHAIEFMVLAAELMTLVLLLNLKPLVYAAFLPLFASLAFGVIDESLQMMNDRSPQIEDILKDFAGAVVGVLTVLCVYAVILCIQKRGSRPLK